jgi:hypothetical protein
MEALVEVVAAGLFVDVVVVGKEVLRDHCELLK